MLTKFIVVMIVQYIHISNHMLCTLKLYNVLCPLYLKAGKKINVEVSRTDFNVPLTRPSNPHPTPICI